MVKEKEQTLTNSIVLAIAVIILAVIAALVVSSILGSSSFSQGQITGTNTNESLGVVTNVTNSTFAIISSQPTANCTLDLIANSTGGEVLTAGNYTFFPSVCNLILQDSSSYIGESLNATYNFSYIDSGSTVVSVSDIKSLFGEFIDGLLGFLGIIGIVLGVIWLIMYVAKLFSKGGLNDLGATA